MSHKNNFFFAIGSQSMSLPRRLALCLEIFASLRLRAFALKGFGVQHTTGYHQLPIADSQWPNLNKSYEMKTVTAAKMLEKNENQGLQGLLGKSRLTTLFRETPVTAGGKQERCAATKAE